MQPFFTVNKIGKIDDLYQGTTTLEGLSFEIERLLAFSYSK
jgi:hypothetical protein